MIENAGHGAGFAAAEFSMRVVCGPVSPDVWQDPARLDRVYEMLRAAGAAAGAQGVITVEFESVWSTEPHPKMGESVEELFGDMREGEQAGVLTRIFNRLNGFGYDTVGRILSAGRNRVEKIPYLGERCLGLVDGRIHSFGLSQHWKPVPDMQDLVALFGDIDNVPDVVLGPGRLTNMTVKKILDMPLGQLAGLLGERIWDEEQKRVVTVEPNAAARALQTKAKRFAASFAEARATYRLPRLVARHTISLD